MKKLPLMQYLIFSCLPYVVSIDFWQYKVEVILQIFKIFKKQLSY